jgi:hypothetical protein
MMSVRWTHHNTNIQIAGKPFRRKHSFHGGIVTHRLGVDKGEYKHDKKQEKEIEK